MQNTGLYKGKPHAKGGIPVSVNNGSHNIEVEGGEFYLCKEAFENKTIFDFRNKTNLEVLAEIFKKASCLFNQDKAYSGDFIVCIAL